MPGQHFFLFSMCVLSSVFENSVVLLVYFVLFLNWFLVHFEGFFFILHQSGAFRSFYFELLILKTKAWSDQRTTRTGKTTKGQGDQMSFVK
jgi:hypothetical protein